MTLRPSAKLESIIIFSISKYRQWVYWRVSRHYFLTNPCIDSLEGICRASQGCLVSSGLCLSVFPFKRKAPSISAQSKPMCGSYDWIQRACKTVSCGASFDVHHAKWRAFSVCAQNNFRRCFWHYERDLSPAGQTVCISLGNSCDGRNIC